MKLFIDDKRQCPQDESGWVHVMSYDDTIEYLLEKGCPKFISFDHDLGPDLKTGYDIAKWLVNRDMDEPGFIPENFKFNVHSANPVGRKNIEMYLNQYLDARQDVYHSSRST